MYFLVQNASIFPNTTDNHSLLIIHTAILGIISSFQTRLAQFTLSLSSLPSIQSSQQLGSWTVLDVLRQLLPVSPSEGINKNAVLLDLGTHHIQNLLL
jgi:hypothetical protein